MFRKLPMANCKFCMEYQLARKRQTCHRKCRSFPHNMNKLYIYLHTHTHACTKAYTHTQSYTHTYYKGRHIEDKQQQYSCHDFQSVSPESSRLNDITHSNKHYTPCYLPRLGSGRLGNEAAGARSCDVM